MVSTVSGTSTRAYQSLESSLNQRESEVYHALEASLDGLTNREIADNLGWKINCVTGRITLLVEKGFVRMKCKSRSAVTSRLNTVWEITRGQGNLFGMSEQVKWPL